MTKPWYQEEANKRRLAFTLKCKPEEVPKELPEIKVALDKRIADLRTAKKVKHGESIHEPI